MDAEVATKTLVCIEYPAIVKNVDKMLETLGGERAISEVHNETNARLGLKFRPDDVYCKSVSGERCNSTSLLLKIICRRKKTKPNEATNNTIKINKVHVLGNIQTSYHFKSLCDYQYLPMQQNNEEKYESLLSSLIPSGLLHSSWLQEASPLFIVPPLFSRINNPSSYHFRKIINTSIPENPNEQSSIIGRARSRRSGYGIFINADDITPMKPSAPGKVFKNDANFKRELLGVLENAFKERPIWSANALTVVANLDRNQLKNVLPALAYYFLTGPWRSLWVRYGYDPRKHPDAKIYQLLDIRIKVPPGMNIASLDGRRHHQIKLATKISNMKPTVRIIETEKLAAASQVEKVDVISNIQDMELKYKFKEGQLPKHRQVFYQICDIEMESVKNLLSRERGDVYHEREGWLTPGTLEKCRKLVLADVTKSFDKVKMEQLAKGVKPEVEEQPQTGMENDETNSDSDFEEEYINFD